MRVLLGLGETSESVRSEPWVGVTNLDLPADLLFDINPKNSSGLYYQFQHGENDFVPSTKRFVNRASAKKNCSFDCFTCYSDSVIVV